LNLLSAGSLDQIADRAGIKYYAIDAVSLFGWPTNLLLFGNKSRAFSSPPHRPGARSLPVFLCCQEKPRQSGASQTEILKENQSSIDHSRFWFR